MKVIVFGASGFLGRTIYYKLKEKNIEVLGTYCSNKKDDYVYVDARDINQVLAVCESYSPDVIVWTIMNHSFEVKFAEDVIPRLCDYLGDIRFIFISTSVAYNKDMDENVIPLRRTLEMYNPQYFNGKIQSEETIKKIKNYCIVRPGSIYGMNPYGEIDFRSRALREVINSKAEYRRATNIIFSIVEVNQLADAVIELISNGYIGTINISEEKPISHYEFNKALCKKYGLDDKYIIEDLAEENIYYLNNDLRKKVLKTIISEIMEN